MPTTFPTRPLAIALFAALSGNTLAHAAGASANAPEPIAIDVGKIVAQARDAARDIERHARDAGRDIERHARDAARDAERHARDAQRHVLDLQEHLLDMELDLASVAFVQSELGGRTEIVKNAPYTAEAVSESVQTLADGNRIVRQTRALLARDSHGRTRQEKTSGSGRRIVYVFDPIAGRNFAMNPDRRTAVRIPRVPAPPVPPVPPLPPVPPVPGAVAVPPVPPVPPVPAVPPVPGVAPKSDARVEIEPGRIVVRRGREGSDEDVRVEVLRIARGDGPMPGLPSALTLPLLPHGKGETRTLGTRDFDGVKAEGTQTTHTIPAGRIGNEKPIVVTSERWFSPDLHIVVFARTVDPRVGESSYRLVNLRREDPPAEAFKVPADYRTR